MSQLLSQVLPAMCQFAAGSVFSSVWEASLLAAMVALSLRMVPRITAAVRYFAWIAVLVIFVLLPFASVFAGHSSSASGNSIQLQSLHLGSFHLRSLHLGIGWSFAIAGLWAGLSIFRGVQLLRSAFRLRGIARRATPVAGSCSAQLSFGKSRTAMLCTSDDVVRPSVIGFFSPRILIPSALMPKVSETELAHIVLHEMEHLRRRDDWVNLLQKIGLVLFPLNPALLWVERRVCVERELACDDGVLRATKAPKAYASCLVNLAEHSILGRTISLALGAWERRPELARRVQHILRAHPDAKHGTLRPAYVAVSVAGLLIAAAALSRSPQLVSFGPLVDMQNAALASTDSPAAFSAPRFSNAYQPVVFHEPAAGSYRATFLKASMPIAPPTHAIHSAKRAVSKQRAAAQQRPHEPSIEQSWMMLTSGAAPQQFRIVRVVLTVPGASQFDVPQISDSYAAVPTDGGWIVIQL